jgi:hypothetical protein
MRGAVLKVRHFGHRDAQERSSEGRETLELVESDTQMNENLRAVGANFYAVEDSVG